MKKNPILYHLFMGQFDKLKTWLAECEDTLFVALDENLILFGEWCAARHSSDEVSLPDWFRLDKQTSSYHRSPGMEPHRLE
ncbi:MAG: RNA ligase family protein [Candidatus Sericytochromatia bacterium]